MSTGGWRSACMVSHSVEVVPPNYNTMPNKCHIRDDDDDDDILSKKTPFLMT